MPVRSGATAAAVLWLLVPWPVAVASGGAQAPAADEVGSARHRALAAARGAVEQGGEPSPEVAGRRAAIARVWDAMMRSPLGPPLAAEHDERPRSLVLHVQTASAPIIDQQVALMERIPADVHLRLVVGGAEAEAALRARLGVGPRPSLIDEAEIVRVPPGRFSSVWARDFAVGDERCQVVPLFLRPGNLALAADPEHPLNEVVDLLAARGTRIVRAPIYFAGGNVLVGRLGSRRLLVCGANDYLLTRDAYLAAGVRIDEAWFIAVLRALFAVDGAVVLGPRDANGALGAQAEALFHLDQAMVFLRAGEVIVHRVDPPGKRVAEPELHASWRRELSAFVERWSLPAELAEVRLGQPLSVPRAPQVDQRLWEREVAALKSVATELARRRDIVRAVRDLEVYAAMLSTLGFRVARMPISEERVVRRQYYANSVMIPGGDRPLLVMPTFGHSDPAAAAEDERARRFFEDRGLDVGTVRDMAHIGFGGNHCLVRRG